MDLNKIAEIAQFLLKNHLDVEYSVIIAGSQLILRP